MLIENTIKAGGITVTVTYRIETASSKIKIDEVKIKERPQDPISVELPEHHSKSPDVVVGRKMVPSDTPPATVSAAAVAPREVAASTRTVPVAPRAEAAKLAEDPNAKSIKGAGPEPTISGGAAAGDSGITIMFGPVIVCSRGAISTLGGGPEPTISLG